ncbi:hypothetical protein GCM10027612_52960 [Microbispora bryophytorum subsp. camponoti]
MPEAADVLLGGPDEKMDQPPAAHAEAAVVAPHQVLRVRVAEDKVDLQRLGVPDAGNGLAPVLPRGGERRGPFREGAAGRSAIAAAVS